MQRDRSNPPGFEHRGKGIGGDDGHLGEAGNWREPAPQTTSATAVHNGSRVSVDHESTLREPRVGQGDEHQWQRGRHDVHEPRTQADQNADRKDGLEWMTQRCGEGPRSPDCHEVRLSTKRLSQVMTARVELDPGHKD